MVVNGVGETTFGKLANLAVRSGYSALIAAADTFRAAAVQQVQVWGDRSDVPVVANPSSNADPAAVVYDAIGAARRVIPICCWWIQPAVFRRSTT